MRKIIVLLLVCVLLAALGFIFFRKNVTSVITKTAQTVQLQVTTPTPFPFEEMTIPYLRGKTYQSALGEMTKISSNGSYDSYTTNYTSDGLRVNGLLTVPNGAMPQGGWPAIVFIHGYIPPTLYQTTGGSYSSHVDFLARNGFVVFKIDLRGNGDSEGRPGGGYFGTDYVTDALNAYSALQTTDFLNPDKIGLWGHSMAGNIVMRSAAVKRDIPGVVIWAGAVYSYVDQRKYGINDNSYRPPQASEQILSRRQELYNMYGTPSADSSFWQKVAPTTYLSDLEGAVEIHHATDDNVVNIGYSRDLIALLDETNVPHVLYEYPSGGHNISGGSFNLAMQRTVTFFKNIFNK